MLSNYKFDKRRDRKCSVFLLFTIRFSQPLKAPFPLGRAGDGLFIPLVQGCGWAKKKRLFIDIRKAQ